MAQLLHTALLKQRDDMEAEAAASTAAEPDAGEEPDAAPTDEEEEEWRQALEDERNADEAMRLEAQQLARLQTLANIATSNSGSCLSLASGIGYPAETYSHRLLYGERDVTDNNNNNSNNMYNLNSLNNLREESKTQDTLTTPAYYSSGYTQQPRRLSDNHSNAGSSYSLNTMARQQSNASNLSTSNGGIYNRRTSGEPSFPSSSTGPSSSSSYGPTLGGIPIATYSTLALTQDEPNFFPINHYRSSSITSNNNNNTNNYTSGLSRNNSSRSSSIPVSVSRERSSLTAPDNID